MTETAKTVDNRETMTIEFLREINACTDATDWFMKNFPTGSAPVREVLMKLYEDGYSGDETRNFVDQIGWAAFYFSQLPRWSYGSSTDDDPASDMTDPSDYFYAVRRGYLRKNNFDSMVDTEQEGILRRDALKHAIITLCDELDALVKQPVA